MKYKTQKEKYTGTGNPNYKALAYGGDPSLPYLEKAQEGFGFNQSQALLERVPLMLRGMKPAPRWKVEEEDGWNLPHQTLNPIRPFKKKDGLESKLDKYLDHPMMKASHEAAEFSEDPGEQVDNFRHPMAGRYTAEALANKFPNWMHSTGVPQLAGFLRANALGIGHEIETAYNTRPGT